MDQILPQSQKQESSYPIAEPLEVLKDLVERGCSPSSLLQQIDLIPSIHLISSAVAINLSESILLSPTILKKIIDLSEPKHRKPFSRIIQDQYEKPETKKIAELFAKLYHEKHGVDLLTLK